MMDVSHTDSDQISYPTVFVPKFGTKSPHESWSHLNNNMHYSDEDLENTMLQAQMMSMSLPVCVDTTGHSPNQTHMVHKRNIKVSKKGPLLLLVEALPQLRQKAEA